jgi:cytochrome c biogenesis protein CcmG, thiol:disulfide interchange protein DsbE
LKIFILFCLSFYLIPIISNAQIVHVEQDSCQISPEFKFITLTGQEVASQDLKGKIIIIDFWSSDCTPCRTSMPQMEKFYQHYKNDQRIAVYLVNSGWETIEKAKSFADTKRSGFLFFSWGTKYDLPFAYDKGCSTLKTFGLDSNPSTIIIDSRFKIRVKHSGFIKDFYYFLSSHVEQYLAEK